MPGWALITIGLLLVAIAIIDVLWSTISTNGGGPIALRVTHGCWTVARLLFKHLRLHRVLEFNAVVILVATFLAWILPMWLGWTLIFSATDEIVIHQATGEAANLVDRIYFSGMVFLTLGTGDFVAHDSNWRLVTVLASLNGLVVITLTITYLVSVISATIEKRHLAMAINLAGRTAPEILQNAWNGHNFSLLEERLYQFSLQLILHADRHLAYPILQYFHPTDREAALSVALALLDDTATLLNDCIEEEDVKISQITMRTLHEALELYIRRVQFAHVSELDEQPPIPGLHSLRQQGIPVCDDATARRVFTERDDFRTTLYSLLRAAGWQWPN